MADTIREEMAAELSRIDDIDWLQSQPVGATWFHFVAEQLLTSAVVARIRAEAWDEGALAVLQLWHGDEPLGEDRPYWWKPVNPYRKETP